MTYLQGLPGAPGLAEGSTFVLEKRPAVAAKTHVENTAAEVAALHCARHTYMQRVAEYRAAAAQRMEEEAAAILDAYLTIAGDDAFFAEVEACIESEQVGAAWALDQKRMSTEHLFAALQDDYLRQRADDVGNVCREIIAEMGGEMPAIGFPAGAGEKIVVFAQDLSPTETMHMDKNRLAGLVTEQGGATSHTAILAKSLGIPAVVGTGPVLAQVPAGVPALIDGDAGLVCVQPDADTAAAFREKRQAAGRQNARARALLPKPVTTADGIPVQVCVNTGDEGSLRAFNANESDGVGLFRTEFLYLNRSSYPGEEEQYAVYKEIASRAQGKAVVIRTLDIGGDKRVEYMNLPREANPFLGYRAIRISLDRPDMFKTQLRAVLRAAVHGNLQVMFPMVATCEELQDAKAVLQEARRELEADGVPVGNVPVGVMIETPAALLLCDNLAAQVDFFSIGTNDLSQYLHAADRMNPRMHHLLAPFNPALLRAVHMVCETGRKTGVHVAICGEAGSEPLLVPLWAAMGVNALSVAPGLVGRTKQLITKTDTAGWKKEVRRVLQCGTRQEVKDHLEALAPRTDG